MSAPWLDAQAQVNLVERLLERFGKLPASEELRALARREPGVMLPTSQMRALRELEPPSADEGFAAVERVEFARLPGSGGPGVFVAASALREGSPLAVELPDAPHLVFDWGTEDLAPLAARIEARVVETACCPHGGGPPSCWCRPPLPGLPLAFAREHGVDPASSVLVGTAPAHKTLAAALGARYIAVYHED